MITFSESLQTGIIHIGSVDAGYAVEGSFSFSENGQNIVGLYFNDLKNPANIDGLRIYIRNENQLLESSNRLSPIVEVGFQKGPAIVSDLNSDGLIDIFNVDHGKEVEGTQVNGSWPGGFNHLISSLASNPVPVQVPVLTTEQRFWHDLDVGDVDGDGDLDIVTTSFNAVYLFTNEGNFEFSSTVLDQFSDHGVVQFIDSNSDGFLEILTAPYIFSQQNQMKLFTSNSGSWSGVSIGPAGLFDGYGAFESEVIKNTDEETLLWVSTENGIGPSRSFILNIGSDITVSVSEVSTETVFMIRDIYAGDFNFDGLTDIFLSTNGNQALGERFFLNNGQNNFSQSQEFISGLPSSGTLKAFPLTETITATQFQLLTVTGNSLDLNSSLVTISLETIEGSFENDQITGSLRSDNIIAGTGDDVIDGGLGTDAVIFSGTKSEYTVQEVGRTVVISDSQGERDGSDTLSSIETYQFTDGAFQLSELLGVVDVDRGIYRFFNVDTGTHFLSGSTVERDSVINNLDQFNYEGPTFRAADSSNAASDSVFRFFNTQTGTHFFTQSTAERDSILDNLPQFSFEGEAYQGYTEQVDGSIPLYRFFNTQTGTHFYTAAEVEKDSIIASLPSFNFEGTAYWVDPVMG